MPTFRPEPSYTHGQAERTAVLLCNLGTPDEATAPAVRRYLAQFLGDHRVVEIPPLAWLPILHGIILRTRPAKSAAKYASIWTPEGSPLAVWTAKQATLLGLVVAIVCAWGKTSGPGWLRFIVNAYIEVIRNTPFIVQLFFFFFALPSIGLRWSPYTAALTAMVVNLGAYAAEIVRAGIESIPKGQIEAGKALNLKPWEIFRFVILKPALKVIYPALTSQFILLMLSSAVVSVISADDLTSVAANLQSQTFRSFEI